jgi:hypothetical protein
MTDVIVMDVTVIYVTVMDARSKGRSVSIVAVHRITDNNTVISSGLWILSGVVQRYL